MTIAANLTLPMMIFGQPASVDGYMASARGLLPSLQLLATSSSEHSRALALVSGVLVECVLKAFLSHKGVTEKELKTFPRGHDLEALWAEAVTSGLPIDLPPPSWCVVLNCLHFGNKVHNENKEKEDRIFFQLRYQSKAHGLSFPVTRDMLSGVRSVFDAVEQALRTP